ncbi:MAG: glutamate-5-semialdehyde dehydrogenase [Acidobacteria bacterium]|nr:glutamate-5-semialdehyde dehydrogenase [Acidobacteriota bacterium]
MDSDATLDNLVAGMTIVYGGNRVTHIPQDLAEAFRAGDRLVVVHDTGALLHIPKSEHDTVYQAVGAAVESFSALGAVSDAAITDFYDVCADNLADDEIFSLITVENKADVADAKARGRSTSRLILSEKMRSDMIDGLRTWRDAPSQRNVVTETIHHDGWQVDQIRCGLGVVGFVFEGRPNVFADATGVLRSGNTVVFRIGSDALRTARAIMRHALTPALEASGLPSSSVVLVDVASHAGAWALFSDSRLAFAVARGSGGAVSQLGAVARQAGIAVSLHGAGGAWIVAADDAEQTAFTEAVYNSLDRKVCNTLNTVAVVRSRAHELVPQFLDAFEHAAQRIGVSPKLHVRGRDQEYVPLSWWEDTTVTRPDGEHTESKTSVLDDASIGEEWEWDGSPEVTLIVVDTVAEAVSLFNEYSPRFVASLISADPGAHQMFFDQIDAPFVGNGFTRWVDGQYALLAPELGLSNWQSGRLFGRGAILSGDSVFTVRSRVTQSDPSIGR